MELDVAPDGRVFYVERITGEINLWNPSNGQVSTAVQLPVSSVQENGLMGIQLDPNFDDNGHLYVTYTPITPNNQSRVSRFTVTGNTIDPASEQVIFTWEAQREQCCHSSGSLAFDAAGDLYISTGDNTNPFGSPADGFAPIDERPGRAFWDAQRTSANTNNLNGKVLRIRPIANATGVPGEGTTYTIPGGNMFPPGTASTRPEIYAMGFRNPFRITIDPHTGWVLLGDYGPDAGATNPNRGPQGSVGFNVVKEPGFYGWPYCVRDNVPYNDFNFATQVSGPKFDCANPVNTSPNNTGLTNLPAAKPATMWLGYSETDSRFPGLGTGGAPTGGPRYEFDADLDSPAKFPASYDRHWFIGEWNNGWIKTATLDDQGTGTGVFGTPWADTFNRPHEMEFGPDGSLYVIDWGSGFNGNNVDSGIYRIDYVAGGRRPIAHATADQDNGPAPLTVQFSSEGSIDPDGGSVTYAWDFDGDGDTDSTDPNPTHTYSTAGTFNAQLTVADTDGQTGFDTIQITAGNTRPTVRIELPEDGQFHAFGDQVPYRIVVTDPETTVDCDEVTLSLQLGHDGHAHGLGQQTGCEGTVQTTTDSGHGANANVFTSLVASYTDEAQGPANALTGQDDVVLQPKPKQAEFFDSTGRAPGGAAGGTPGVQTESTADAGGGLNIGFIEHGDYVSFERTNLKDLTGLRFRVASAGAGGTIQVRLGAPDGELVAETATIAPTGGWQNWVNVDLPLTDAPEGTHELFVVFNNPAAGNDSLMNLNWFEGRGKGAAVSASPEVTGSAEPSSGQAPLAVQFTGDATDPDAEPGEQMTFAWDFGVAGTNEDTSTEQNPTYTYERPGTYMARFTATDPHGQSATSSVEVRVAAPPSQCPQDNVRSDEFDGDSLDTNRWTIIRPDNTRPPTVQGGALRFPIDQGSLYGPGTSARNIIVQPLPDGDVEVTAKITTEPLTENYQQAGLRVYDGDDNWASVHMIHAGGNRDFEFIYENAGNPRNEAADKLGGIPADSPLTYWVKLISDGSTLQAQYSWDGETFNPVGRPADISGWANPRVGPVALSDQAPSFPVASFDWIRFNPDGTGGGGGGQGIVDEFDGSQLGDDWDVVRQDQLLTVSGGALRIPAQVGDIYQGTNTAKNLVMRPAPDGAWQATAKVNFKGVSQYHQAGIMVYGDDQNFTKFGRLTTNAAGSAFSEKFEFIYENDGVARNDAADSTPALPAGFPADFWVRITSDGTSITGHYSTDGSAWTPVGRPAPLPANPKIGMFAFSNAATGDPEAAFDSFTLTGDEVGGGPSGPSFDDEFDGSSLDKDRWNAIVRDNPAAYELSGGQLTLTTEAGDIYSDDTDPPPNNFILQDAAHAGEDWVIETKVDSRVNGGYGQGGLLAYVDGNNYVKLDPIADAGQTRINRIELRTEVTGTPTGPTGTPDPVIEDGTGTVFYLRLTKDGESYTGEYSRDGETWLPAGTVANPMQDPKFGLFAFGPQADGVGDQVMFDYFLLDGRDAGEPCECVGSGDAFEGASLDKTRWNAIVREDESLYSLQYGALNVTTVNGDIYQDGNPASTRNFFLQTPDHAGSDWVIETKVDASELSGGYEQAGLLAFEDEDNYVKFDVLSDQDQTVLNRIELRSEVEGAVLNPQPQLTPLPANDGTVWLRLTKTGTDYKGEYSFDGTTWTAFAETVPNTAMASPRFGLFTLGVNSGGGTARFDYFTVDGAEPCEPPDENAPPVIGSVSAEPATGFAPHEVSFDVDATDADEGDELSYSWDFDGDGEDDSTEQSPTHIYTEAGDHEAEVTVSDGEAERSRTVTVTTLEADDPEARFRVLVFSKTAGFRHDSIDEGHAAIEDLGEQENFQVDHTEDAGAFRDAVLEHYDTIVWLSTTGDVLSASQQDAFERYIKGGGGYTGIHAAADTEYAWKWYGNLVGAYFKSHPPGTPAASVDIEDTDDPSTTGIPVRWDRVDEWYNYKAVNFEETADADYSPRANVHVLASVDEATYEEGDGSPEDADDHPISWCRRYDGGRSWYTGMGHTAASFSEPHYLTHILGGIEVAAGAAESEECGEQTGGPGAPTVEAFADPSSGVAPLRVKFSSAAIDPEGGRLTYEWDFGDGEMSFARSPAHTYVAAGEYEATVTVTDREGKKGTASVTVTVTGDGAPTVEASADPTSGGAPLAVRFDADANDPNGPRNRLTYEWDFGDDGSSFERRPRHVYREPGVFTATVTVTDADGATGTDTVQITVTNAAPTVQAAGDPRSGTAPLRVRFSSQGSDANGGPLTYAWTFGDGGTASTRNAVHTYLQAGTYSATVTVTDRHGATGTATVQVTAANPPGNGAPTVRATADPKTGNAPLRVRFSAAGSDPDRDPLTYVWDFGDGGKAGGATATHRYSQPGTYSATVTVKDPGGRTGTATVTVTVNGQGSRGARASTPSLRLNRIQRVRKVLAKGLRYRISCDAPCRVTSKLRLGKRTIGKAKARRLEAGQTRTLAVRLRKGIRSRLLDAMREAEVTRVKAKLVTKVRIAGSTKTIKRQVTLKRN
jgi:cytochrome c